MIMERILLFQTLDFVLALKWYYYFSEKVDILYLDNTYCAPGCVFPTRDEATSNIIKIIEDHPTHDVLIAMRNLGKEDLLCKIAVHFKEWISVPHKFYSTLEILGVPDVFDNSSMQHRIRVVPFHRVSNRFVSMVNEEQPTIVILPTALYHGIEATPYENNENVFIVPYSDHSSYSEIREFVSYIKPKKIIPVVKSSARGPFGISIADRADMTCFAKFTSNDWISNVTIPVSVKAFMYSKKHTLCVMEKRGMKRKTKSNQTQAKKIKRGIMYDSPISTSRDESRKSGESDGTDKQSIEDLKSSECDKLRRNIARTLFDKTDQQELVAEVVENKKVLRGADKDIIRNEKCDINELQIRKTSSSISEELGTATRIQELNIEEGLDETNLDMSDQDVGDKCENKGQLDICCKDKDKSNKKIVGNKNASLDLMKENGFDQLQGNESSTMTSRYDQTGAKVGLYAADRCHGRSIKPKPTIKVPLDFKNSKQTSLFDSTLGTRTYSKSSNRLAHQSVKETSAMSTEKIGLGDDNPDESMDENIMGQDHKDSKYSFDDSPSLLEITKCKVGGTISNRKSKSNTDCDDHSDRENISKFIENYPEEDETTIIKSSKRKNFTHAKQSTLSQFFTPMVQKGFVNLDDVVDKNKRNIAPKVIMKETGSTKPRRVKTRLSNDKHTASNTKEVVRLSLNDLSGNNETWIETSKETDREILLIDTDSEMGIAGKSIADTDVGERLDSMNHSGHKYGGSYPIVIKNGNVELEKGVDLVDVTEETDNIWNEKNSQNISNESIIAQAGTQIQNSERNLDHYDLTDIAGKGEFNRDSSEAATIVGSKYLECRKLTNIAEIQKCTVNTTNLKRVENVLQQEHIPRSQIDSETKEEEQFLDDPNTSKDWKRKVGNETIAVHKMFGKQTPRHGRKLISNREVNDKLGDIEIISVESESGSLNDNESNTGRNGMLKSCPVESEGSSCYKSCVEEDINERDGDEDIYEICVETEMSVLVNVGTEMVTEDLFDHDNENSKDNVSVLNNIGSPEDLFGDYDSQVIGGGIAEDISSVAKIAAQREIKAVEQTEENSFELNSKVNTAGRSKYGKNSRKTGITYSEKLGIRQQAKSRNTKLNTKSERSEANYQSENNIISSRHVRSRHSKTMVFNSRRSTRQLDRTENTNEEGTIGRQRTNSEKDAQTVHTNVPCTECELDAFKMTFEYFEKLRLEEELTNT